MWYKFIKTIGGCGIQVTTYHFLKEGENIDEQCQLFGENSDGGHRYGYSLKYEEVKRPPQKWVNEQLKRNEIYIEGAKKELIKLIKKEEFLKSWVNVDLAIKEHKPKYYFFYISFPVINMLVNLNNPDHVNLIEFLQEISPKNRNWESFDNTKSQADKARRLMKKAGLFELDKDGRMYTGVCGINQIDCSFREGKSIDIEENFKNKTFKWTTVNAIKI